MTNLNAKMQTLVAGTQGENVVSMTAHQLRQAFSTMVADKGLVLMHLAYPAVDSRNHKSLDALVVQLTSHGFAETANLVADEVPYLVFDDLAKALKVFHEVQKDSMAITVSLYFAGHSGKDAEEALLAKLPHHDQRVLLDHIG